VKGVRVLSSGRHHHVKEIWGQWGPVRHKMGRDQQAKEAARNNNIEECYIKIPKECSDE